VYGLEKLHTALLERPKGKPLLTVCDLLNTNAHCAKGIFMGLVF